MTRKIIEITRRSEDWHACLKNYPEVWGCGRSIDDAVLDCVSHHLEHFELRYHHEGDRVHFTDPGEDVSTGPGTVVKVQHSPVMPDTVISLKMDDEGEVEAFPHELKRLTE